MPTFPSHYLCLLVNPGASLCTILGCLLLLGTVSNKLSFQLELSSELLAPPNLNHSKIHIYETPREVHLTLQSQFMVCKIVDYKFMRMCMKVSMLGQACGVNSTISSIVDAILRFLSLHSLLLESTDQIWSIFAYLLAGRE